jgi:hypothetical protein
MSVDAESIRTALKLDPTSLPGRSDIVPDFKYGDAREAIAAAAAVVQDIKEHCWIGDPAKFDLKCWDYPEIDMLYKVGVVVIVSLAECNRSLPPFPKPIHSCCDSNIPSDIA